MNDHVSLPGVPKSITRTQYADLVKSLGLEINDLISLEFKVHGIYAEVYAGRGLDGGRYAVDDKTVATHRISIEVVDEKDPAVRPHVGAGEQP